MNKCRLRNIVLALALMVVMPGIAKAACSSPSGAEGDLTYNTTHHMMQFCNGSDWVAMAGSGGSAGNSCSDGVAPDTTPFTPHFTGQPVLRISGGGTYIYFTRGSDGLYAASFDGTAWTFEARLDTAGYAVGVTALGGFIFLADGTDGVFAYTFDGTSFNQIAQYDTPGFAVELWTDGTNVFVADDTSGVVALTFDGSSFSHQHTYDTPDNAISVWSDGSNVFVADGQVGSGSQNLFALNYNSGSGFSLADTFVADNSATSVAGGGGYVYLYDSYQFSESSLYALTFDGANFNLLKQHTVLTDGWSGNQVIYKNGTIFIIGSQSHTTRAYSFDGADFILVATYPTGGNGVYVDASFVYVPYGYGWASAVMAYSLCGD